MNIPHALADCIGLGTLVEIVQARKRGYPINVFGRPFYLGADALQLATIICAIVGVYYSHAHYLNPRSEDLSTPWFIWGVALGTYLAAWGWCWGFICHPRRTRLGKRVDVLLAPLFDPTARPDDGG